MITRKELDAILKEIDERNRREREREEENRSMEVTEVQEEYEHINKNQLYF